jgi:ABC-type polysaccharide/polyol phosphate export permease
MVGLIMMNFFNQAVGTSIDLFRANAWIIKSIKIPYEVFVLSTIFQAAFSHIFELLLVAILFLYFHISLVGLIWYVVIFIFYAMFTLGLGFLFSTIGLYFSDFRNIWSIVAQLLFFITPIFYVVNPGNYIYTGNLFNPLYYFMMSIRDAAIYGLVPSFYTIIVMLVLGVGSMVIGFSVFTRFKGRFAEFI